MNSLITLREILQKGPTSNDYPTNAICDNMGVVEFDLFDDCFSIELLDTLKGLIVDYTGTKDYCEETEYNIDYLTLHNGLIWTSKINKNAAVPCEPEWCRAPKFEDECLSKFWDCFFCPWLAYMVMYCVIDLGNVKFSKSGPGKIESKDGGFSNLSTAEICRTKGSIKKLADMKFKVLKRELSRTECDVLKSNKDECDPCKDSKDCGTRRQRMY